MSTAVRTAVSCLPQACICVPERAIGALGNLALFGGVLPVMHRYWVVVLACALVLAACSSTHNAQSGSSSPSTASPSTPSASPFEFRSSTHHYSIEIPAGWFRSEQPLEPWLESPHEILSLATVSVRPSPLPGNQAACPSEIPKVAVDAIGRAGAYLGIYEWIRGEGQYVTEPRPVHAALLHWVRECPLPNGIVAFGATFTDGTRDFTVHMVLGADAATRRAAIYAALDSFHPDARSAATTAPTASHP